MSGLKSVGGGIEKDEWIYANIAAYNGVMEPMEQVFEKCIGQAIQA